MTPGHTHSRRTALISLALLGALSTTPAATLSAQSPAQDDITRAVRTMLERLPYYGVFDYIAFAVDGGTVTLVGYSYHPTLKTEADMVTRMATGVTEVSNKIEVLPLSFHDDRIRWATFYRIYADDWLSRYARGGVSEVWREFADQRRFPGMQPIGAYPIHIVVRNGRTMLLGVVDSALDRRLAEVRAREVIGAFEVTNELVVRAE